MKQAVWKGLSLFSGIGGLDLAFEQAGGEVIAMCEIEPYCQKVLRRHWPLIRLFEDIRELKGSDVGTVDIIYGGFPCQPFSVAGNQRGKDDSRYLWPEFSRLVGEVRPRWILAENVSGILRIAADDVCGDLERQGYTVGIWNYEAAAVGALHRRERVFAPFFVAHTRCTLRTGSFEQGTLRDEIRERASCEYQRSGCSHASDSDEVRCGRRTSQGQGIQREESPFNKVNASCEVIADSPCERFKKQWESFKAEETHSITGLFGRWEPEPPVDRVANGIPHRVDRLRALGNAVVPQQVYPLFKAIMEADN